MSTGLGVLILFITLDVAAKSLIFSFFLIEWNAYKGIILPKKKWTFGLFLPYSSLTSKQLINIIFRPDGLINDEYKDWSKCRILLLSGEVLCYRHLFSLKSSALRYLQVYFSEYFSERWIGALETFKHKWFECFIFYFADDHRKCP